MTTTNLILAAVVVGLLLTASISLHAAGCVWASISLSSAAGSLIACMVTAGDEDDE